jgi:leucyl/phenylalanyl-tRNA--protein transferase
MTLQPIWITEDAPVHAFPDVDYAMIQPNGLLAVGGDLSPARLLHAYQRGIFPWFSEGQPILWWAPDPRAVLLPGAVKISRSLKKTLRREKFQVTFDRAFHDVIQACAAPRAHQNDTWITNDMIDAYCALHYHGFGHSVECWEGGELVGGLYGVGIGKIFFGESMFSRSSDASKVALVSLCESGYELVDCQLPSDHLKTLGSTDLPRREFMTLLRRWRSAPNVILGPS